MAIRQIRLENDEILRKRSREVEEVDDRIVIDLYDGNLPLKLVNPKIIKQKGEQEVDEGCLSFPNEYAKMIRPAEVTVEALDENGKKVKIKAEGLLAQALSHEIDHLDGILFVDKMIPGTLHYVDPNEEEK